jgi:hypothetical protein
MTAIAHVNNPIALTSDLDRLLALVDFEWVRLGPVDLELEAFIRFGVSGRCHTPQRTPRTTLAAKAPRPGL